MRYRNVVILTMLMSLWFNSYAHQTTAVSSVQTPQIQGIDGVVEAINQSTVTSLVNAKVLAIHVDVDDFVAADTLLVELDDTRIRASLEQAEAGVKIATASLTQARLELQRLTDLKSSSYVSESQLNAAQANADKALGQLQFYQAQVLESKQHLSNTKIIAPFSGVVVQRHIEVGETALVGSPLLTGFAVGQNRLVAHMPLRLVPYVEKSKALYIENKDKNWIEIGNPIIAPSADSKSHTVMVRAVLDQASFNVRPGSFIKVGVNVGDKLSLLVPTSSVIHQGDLVAVFVHLDGQFLLRQIRIGKQVGDSYEVLSGLSAGTSIAINGSAVLASQNQSVSARAH